MRDFHKIIIISTLFLLLDRESAWVNYTERTTLFCRTISRIVFLVFASFKYENLWRLKNSSFSFENPDKCAQEGCLGMYARLSFSRVLLERRSDSRPNSKRWLKRDTSTCKQFPSNEDCASCEGNSGELFIVQSNFINVDSHIMMRNKSHEDNFCNTHLKIR